MTSDLLSRANMLEKMAKAVRDSAGSQQELERTKTAVEKLRLAVLELATRLQTRSALDEVGTPRDVARRFRAPLDDLIAFVNARGRPSPQKLQATTDKVRQQVVALDEETRARWQSWTADELREIPRHKTAALPQAERTRVDALVRILEGSAKKEPTAEIVREFRNYLLRVQGELKQVELSRPILEVLERFTTPSGIALSDLSDEELATLRSNPSIASQFVIRRQV